MELCYEPDSEELTATITTLAGEAHAYTVYEITPTGAAQYGLGMLTGTAEFCRFNSTEIGIIYAEPDCDTELRRCLGCSPSCAVVESPFPGPLSACDWDGPGYVFQNGWAIGTGTLRHRTQIYTVPITCTALVSGHGGGYYYRLKIGGATVTYDTSDWGPGRPIALEFKLCLYQDFAVDERHNEYQSVSNVFPTQLEVSTDDPNSAWQFVRARRGRHFGGYPYQCDGCIVCAHCQADHAPADVMVADFGPAGFLSSVKCVGCPTVGGQYRLGYKPWGVHCAWFAAQKICDCTDRRFYVIVRCTPAPNDPGYKLRCGNVTADYCEKLFVPWTELYLVYRVMLAPPIAFTTRYRLDIRLVPNFGSGALIMNNYAIWDSATDQLVGLAATYESEEFTVDKCDLQRTLTLTDQEMRIICAGAFPSSITLDPTP
jgi:hypothetical protein